MQIVESGDIRKQLESAQFDLDNKTSNVASAEEKLRESEAELNNLRSKNEELESSISSTSEHFGWSWKNLARVGIC